MARVFNFPCRFASFPKQKQSFSRSSQLFNSYSSNFLKNKTSSSNASNRFFSNGRTLFNSNNQAHLFGWDLTSDGKLHATTILTVRKDKKVVVIGDGQITLGSERVKVNAKKVRRMADNKILVGFAGGVTDALALCEKLEQQIEKCNGQLLRAAVEMSKAWRMDKFMGRLEAVLIVVDRDVSLTISGGGEIVEHNDGIQGIGSGGAYAKAAARALIDQPLDAEEIAKKAMTIAADMCVYTSNNFVIETIDYSNQGDIGKYSRDQPSLSSPPPSSTPTENKPENTN